MIRLDEQYPALSGGVAERPRAQQDMAELLAGSNVWFDSRHGLTRRPAARLVSRTTSGAYNNTNDTPHSWGGSSSTAPQLAASSGVVAPVQELAYEYRGEQYALFVSKDAPADRASPVYAVRKSDGRRIVAPVPGTGVEAALAYGANAAAVVGDLLVLAPRAANRHESHPTYTVARPWAIQANQQNLAAWVRGGAFARPYKLTLVRGDSRMWVQYTTLSEAYPAKLDTSDIPTSDPDYSKKVNDRTNAYNAAATAWLAAALADITPENIATRLAAAVTASGYLAPSSTAVAVGSSVLITDPSIEELFVEDGGDGSLIMAAGNTIPSAASVVAFHLPGKILKILPGSEGGANSFYLKAVAKDQSTGAMTQVSWEECAGEELVADSFFVYGALGQAADPTSYPEGRLFLERSISALNAAAGTDFPVELPNISGDMTTNPPPAFYSKEISAMAAFQDRLVMVCSGGAVSTSQPGDYLNFFRTSMLTALPRDPVEFTIIGGEGDTVRHAIKYDRNLLLIGTQQYMIPGRNALIPGQAAASIYSQEPGMDTVEPAIHGGMVVFARYSGGQTTLHAMRAGKVVEDPQVVDLTSHAPAITARPVRLLAADTPAAILLLTEDAATCYLVTFVEQRGEVVGGAVWPWSLSVPTGVTNIGPFAEDFTNVLLQLNGDGLLVDSSSYARTLTAGGTPLLNSTLPLNSTDTYEIQPGDSIECTADLAATVGASEWALEMNLRYISASFGVEGNIGNFPFGQVAVNPSRQVRYRDPSVGVDLQAPTGIAAGAFAAVTIIRDNTSHPTWARYHIAYDGTVVATSTENIPKATTETAEGTRVLGFDINSPSIVVGGWRFRSGTRYYLTNAEGEAPNTFTPDTYPFLDVGAPEPEDEPAAGLWSVVGAYASNGVFNHLWLAKTVTGTSSPWPTAVAYHLTGMDFRAGTASAGWWGSRLGPLPFSGYGDFDTFSVVPSPWTGSYLSQAGLVPPTHYVDKGFRVPIVSTDLGAMRQTHPLTVVSYRVHYADTSYAQAVVGSAIWWQQAAVNPNATPVTDGGWAFRQDSGTPATAPAVTATADFLSPVPVGRLVHQAGVTLRSVDKHPFTISGVQWTGALHTRSDRG